MPRSAATLLALAAMLVISPPLPSNADDLTATVTAMTRIGRAYAPQFSPDGSRIAYLTDLSGLPQVWVVPTAGGYPEAVTTFEDPVTALDWSPKGDWLAVTVAPGGGLNSQIYVVRSNGSGVRRLTEGGKENNWLGGWTRDGKLLSLSSSRRDPAAMDSYLADPVAGTLTLVAENPGVGYIADVSADNRHAVVERTKSRGDNDLYLVEVKSRRETRITPHNPPAEFGGGDIAPDGRTVYLTSDDGRDLSAFGRVRLGASGKPGPIEILAERPGAELDGYALNEAGTVAALVWNVAGRSELEFYDLGTGKGSNGPELPA
jgi:dipeptidyl aminopeptidase/acylaminoacyl peptidase